MLESCVLRLYDTCHVPANATGWGLYLLNVSLSHLWVNRPRSEEVYGWAIYSPVPQENEILET